MVGGSPGTEVERGGCSQAELEIEEEVPWRKKWKDADGYDAESEARPEKRKSD
jgi:hypothetical protein